MSYFGWKKIFKVALKDFIVVLMWNHQSVKGIEYPKVSAHSISTTPKPRSSIFLTAIKTVVYLT